MRRAGQYRHFIELQSAPTGATRTSTGFSLNWETYARQYAAVFPAPAGQGERPIANTTDAVITHIVETDYLSGVEPTHRIRTADGTLLYLVGMPENVDLRNKTLRLPCEQRAA